MLVDARFQTKFEKFADGTLYAKCTTGTGVDELQTFFYLERGGGEGGVLSSQESHWRRC